MWVSGIAKTSIWQGKYCKNQLSQKLDFLWFQGPFFMILGSLGTNFHDYCCPGDWLENWWIFRVILGASQIQSIRLVGGKLVHPRALSNTVPGSLNTTLEMLRPMGILRWRRGYIGYMGHWKRDYTRIPRSLVARSRGAGGYKIEDFSILWKVKVTSTNFQWNLVFWLAFQIFRWAIKSDLQTHLCFFASFPIFPILRAL